MVPKALKDAQQWLLWKFEQKPGDKKPRKMPYYVSGKRRQGVQGNADDRGALTYFEAAVAAKSLGGYDGIGFAFLPDDGFIGIDLDSAFDDQVNEDTGEIKKIPKERTAKIIEACASFTEISPSGNGVHIYVHGSIPKSFKNNDIGVEVFCRAQFFTVTGDHYPGTPEEVMPITEPVINRLRATVETARKQTTAAAVPGAVDQAAAKPAPARSRVASGEDDFHRVNDAAIAQLDAWVPTLLPGATRVPGGWRVTSKALGRDLQEDLSIRSDGIVDWGVNDIGDPRQGRRTPIDLVMEWGKKKPGEALRWLAPYVGIEVAAPRARRPRAAPAAAGGGGESGGGDDMPPDDPPPDDESTGEQDPQLPLIDWTAGDLPEIVDQAEAALLAAKCGMYQRSNMLVRVVRRDTPSVRNYQRDPGALGIVMVDTPHLVETLTRVARWQKFEARTQKWRPINAPEQVASTYIARSGHWRLPRLRATLSAPTLRPDGSLLQTPGYDSASQSWYDPCGVQYPVVPDAPTMDDVDRALKLLDNAFATFPFETEIDRSVALSLLLCALVRRSLPSAPLGAITAPVMASGKTLLADCIAIMAIGVAAPAMKYPDSDEEAAKTALAVLAEGDPVVLIDNVERPLQGDWLCSVLTSETYRQRMLGRTEMMEVPTTTLWLATGNHLVIAGDLRTRALLCRLDPKVERPEQRVFKHDLRMWMTAHRPQLVAAGLTVMRAFIARGVPATDYVKPWGRFEHWSAMVRAPLVWLGFQDPCESLKSLEDDDPERNEYLRLVHAWRKCFNGEAKTAREAVEAAKEPPLAGDGEAAMYEILREIALDRSNVFNVKRLAKWLGRHVGRRVDGVQLVKAGEQNHVALWKVEEVKPPTTT